MTPSSTNGGGLNQFNSSQNSLYSSHFSANSRFTTTRPVSFYLFIKIRKIQLRVQVLAQRIQTT